MGAVERRSSFLLAPLPLFLTCRMLCHAYLQGCKATICMPVSTPDIKVSNVRRLGGEVELVGESYQETQAHAVQVRGRFGGFEVRSPWSACVETVGAGRGTSPLAHI